MWLCYGVHIIVCMALIVYVLCHPVHSLSHPYISKISFLKSFYGDHEYNSTLVLVTRKFAVSMICFSRNLLKLLTSSNLTTGGAYVIYTLEPWFKLLL